MLVIPTPRIAPFGLELTAEGLQDVWNTFVKPDQDAGVPQSSEMRALMAILRAVYAGYANHAQAERVSVKVTPLYPGFFVSEEGQTVRLESEKLEDLLAAAPQDERWFALQVRVVDEERWLNSSTGEERWIGDHATRSYRVYVGELLDVDAVRALPNPEAHPALLSNMEINGWSTVVRTRLGNFQPLDAQDVVLDVELNRLTVAS